MQDKKENMKMMNSSECKAMSSSKEQSTNS